MPLEISEISVHIAVGPPVDTLQSETTDAGGGDNCGKMLTPERMEQLVDASARQVLASLRRMEER